MSDEEQQPATPEKNFAGFVSAAMDFLNAQGPQSSVVIIVEGQRGFQTFRNQDSLPWLLGACACAIEMFKALGAQAHAQRQQDMERIALEEEKRIQTAVQQTTKGKTN